MVLPTGPKKVGETQVVCWLCYRAVAGKTMFTNNLNQGRLHTRKRTMGGAGIAEAGPTLWFLIVGLAFPIIAYVTMFYRATFVDFAMRDASYRAAKSSTYATVSTNGVNAYNTDLTNIPGISTPSNPTFKCIIQPTGAGATGTPQSLPL